MREISSSSKLPTNKFADQNQVPKLQHQKHGSNGNQSKLKSATSWGSHIVKGFSAEKKTKQQQQQIVVQSKKPPLSSSNSSQPKHPFAPDHSKVKRSILGDFQCSAANSAQVYPHSSSDSNKTSASRDLLLELDNLRELLRESKERELKLKSEVLECKSNPRVLELEREVEVSKRIADDLSEKVSLLEAEKTRLSEQLVSISSSAGETQDQASSFSSSSSSSRDDQENLTPINGNLEMEVVELRRLNKELQLHKRTLACQLSSAEAQLAALEKISQSETVAKVQAEASMLRHTNENLSKQVEGLQMSRLTEVEELVYLRWVNSCLRNELRNLGSGMMIGSESSDKDISPSSIERYNETLVSSYSLCKETMEFDSEKRLTLVKKLKKWPLSDDNLSNLECPDKNWGEETQEETSPRRRHSISGSNCSLEELSSSSKRRQSDGFICSKDADNGEPVLVSAQKFDFSDAQSPRFFLNKQDNNKISSILDIEKRALRIPNPPPRPSGLVPNVKGQELAPIPLPPPPPPPPPMKFSTRNSTSMVQRAPQVVEFYHTLMKRESRKDSSGGGICDAPDVANVRSCMIDEIENRSSYLLAIKADVETQGEFVNSLIREVNTAVYQDIEDVVAFVKWLDDELCFLVDERAVLKHFEWPEKKADTLREAAFGYRDLKKLESEVSYYEDDPRVPCEMALKKMVSLSEKMERSVYNILRTRDALMRHCKEFQIPTDWMLDTGIISKIKFGSVKLAKKYMKRVAMELQSKRASEKDPSLEYMLLQGVRFAFRIHQFAGGFDAETMHAFEELRSLAYDIRQL